MRAFRNFCVIVAIFGGLAFFSDTAGASDCYKPKYSYKTVITWETVEIPVVHYLIKYDCDGYPYKTKVTSYRTRRVAVEKRVLVAI